MSKLILWNLISLDGFFDGAKSWELDWFPSSMRGLSSSHRPTQAPW